MDTQLENEQQAIEWVRRITPFAVKPTKKAKTTFVSPFTSRNAYIIVTEEIGKSLFKDIIIQKKTARNKRKC
jgi:hypothetical protein